MEPRALPIDDRAVVRPGGDLLEGTPYRIVQPLGLGGMGEVFEAEHRALGHRVVVKVLIASYAARPDMRDRMRIEAQALARIRHPNLVMVTDFGETRAGHQFIVMERLVGWTLREELEDSTVVTPRDAAEIARQMLLGLHAAHLAGLVHRDVKPENVFLCATEDDRRFAKVLDFGVVKITEASGDARTPLPLVVPTRDGLLLGTPRYFSPEQARQERDLDARSDVYSTALVLYEMLAGHGPFPRARSLEELYRAHATEAPEPLSIGGDTNLAMLDPVVLRALAKRREDRHPTALAFAEDLERYLIAIGEGERWFAAPRPVFAGVPDARSLAEAETAPDMTVRPKPAPPGASATLLEAPPDLFTPAAPSAPAEPPAVIEPRAGVEPRAASRRLSDAPVVMDHMIERALGSTQDRSRAAALGLPSDATEPHVRVAQPHAAPAMTDTVPMMPLAPPAAPLASPAAPLASPAAPLASSAAPNAPPVAPLVPAPATLSTPQPAARPGVPDTVPMLDLAAAVRASAPPSAPAHAEAPARDRALAPPPPAQPTARPTSGTPRLVIVALLAIALILALVIVFVLRAHA